MDIAQAKRKENIAEYILYLWQLEDLLRALQFSPEAIYSQLVAPRQVEEEQKHLFLLWYMDIVNLLRKEGKEESGHLEHTLHLIGDMHNLHLQLMQNPVGEHYRKTFARLAPMLPQLRTLVKKDNISDTERGYNFRGNKNVNRLSISFVFCPQLQVACRTQKKATPEDVAH